MLENVIDDTMKKSISKAFSDYEKYKNRLEFIEKEKISQVILVISQINWTLDTEALLDNLEDYKNMLIKQLEGLTGLISRPDLDPLKRRTLIALITQDVHNRDVV